MNMASNPCSETTICYICNSRFLWENPQRALKDSRKKCCAQRQHRVLEVITAVVQKAAAEASGKPSFSVSDHFALDKPKIGTRFNLQHERKIFRAHAGLKVTHLVMCAHQLLSHFSRQLQLCWQIDSCQINAFIVDGGGGGGTKSLRYVLHTIRADAALPHPARRA